MTEQGIFQHAAETGLLLVVDHRQLMHLVDLEQPGVANSGWIRQIAMLSWPESRIRATRRDARSAPESRGQMLADSGKTGPVHSFGTVIVDEGRCKTTRTSWQRFFTRRELLDHSTAVLTRASQPGDVGELPTAGPFDPLICEEPKKSCPTGQLFCVSERDGSHDREFRHLRAQ